MDQWGPKHVELTYVMNKTQSLKNFVYLVGLHIYNTVSTLKINYINAHTSSCEMFVVFVSVKPKSACVERFSKEISKYKISWNFVPWESRYFLRTDRWKALTSLVVSASPAKESKNVLGRIVMI